MAEAVSEARAPEQEGGAGAGADEAAGSEGYDALEVAAQDVTQHGAELQAVLQRLYESGVSSAGSATAQQIVQALAQGRNLWATDAEAAQKVIHQDNKIKYNAAVGRGIKALIGLTEEIILRVLADPARHRDLVVQPQQKRKRGAAQTAPAAAVIKSPTDSATHASWRYVLYREAATALEYGGGERVPLPTVVEVLIKVCFPGPVGQAFTFFTPSEVASEVVASEVQVGGEAAAAE